MLPTSMTALLARGALSCALLAALAPSAAAQVRVRQVFGGGGTTGALYTQDFVELVNLGAPQSLAGWSLQSASALGGTWSVAPLPAVVLGSGSSFLVHYATGSTLGAGQALALPTADASTSLALASSSGKLALVSSTVALSGATPSSPTILDFVGYGPAASWNEPGAPFSPASNAPSPGAEHALLRWNCATPDSDANDVDWAVVVPSPRNSALAPNVGLHAVALCAPRAAEAGQSVRLTVDVRACGGALLSGAANVNVDLTPLGGAANVALLDDGLAGDAQAGDGVYSTLASVAPGTPVGTSQLRVSIADGALSTQLFAGLEVRPTAAPNNDACASALALGPSLPASVSGTFAQATAEHNPLLSGSSIAPPGSMGARRGVWFRVVGTGTTLSASTCASPLNAGAIPDTVLMVLAGDCDALSVVAYNDDAPALCGAGSGTERRSSVAWCAAAGETYWIWLAPFLGGSQTFAYTLDVVDDGLPCASAAPFALCAAPSGGSLELEASVGPAANDGCDSNAEFFVSAAPSFPAQRWVGTARQQANARDTDWYRFQASSSTSVTAQLEAQFHGVLEVWALNSTGSCSGAALLSSSAPAARCSVSAINFSVVAGEWYAVRVVPQNTFAGAAFGGFSPGGRGVGYALELALPNPIPNDTCLGAFALACPSSTSGATTGADIDLGAPICVAPGGQDASPLAPGVWYSLTLPGATGLDDRVVSAQLSSAAFDARISVFEGACGSLVCVAANDDASPAGLPLVAWRASAATNYWILVHGAPSESGAFQLELECALPAANDDCASATLLSSASGALAGDFVGATASVGSAWTQAASCAPPYAFFDVWYELELDCATNVSLDTCGASDTLLSVHSACPSASATFELGGACNDDGAGACAPGAELSLALGPGSYLVRVASAAPAGAFTLTWSQADSDGDGALDCVDGCPLDPLKLAPGACGCGSIDVDSDGDGAFDCVDACPLDPLKIAPGQCGCGVADLDSDGDGTADCVDNCPLDPLKLAPGQCGCGVVDLDSDGDAVADCVDGCPLDPLKLAPGACGCGTPDVDSDGDGALDCVDGCPLDPLKLAPGACGCGTPDVDSDGDGALDCVDGCPLDPLKLAPGACGCGTPDVDSDGDGAFDCVDNCPLDPLKTSPGQCGCSVVDLDSDADGTADCVDDCPLDPLKTAPGQCGCGVADLDSDGDSVADCVDGCPLDPLKLTAGACGCGTPDVDSDGDGALDCVDGCPFDPLKLAPGTCGCGSPDVDSDGDGALDCVDGCPFDPLKLAPGACGCGTPEVDSDGDGAFDCVDNCPLDPLKTAPGQCGCGVADLDTDGDRVADCVDNCDALANPAQADCDLDGVGDVCEYAAGTARDLNNNGQPDNCELGAFFNYCTAGTSTAGCTAAMGASGVLSASATSGFMLGATGVEGDKLGILFYSISGPASQPWFGGSTSFKCVKSPMQRLTPLVSGGTAGACDGQLMQDVQVYFAANPAALGAPLTVGGLYSFQAWYRDPPAPATTSLSDALQVTCAP
ncbi:MAG: hypothetical protein JNN27_04275 [Planctomycetes bacterium]|nr:hypothetical protein [Planctomycetota bacterium]